MTRHQALIAESATEAGFTHRTSNLLLAPDKIRSARAQPTRACSVHRGRDRAPHRSSLASSHFISISRKQEQRSPSPVNQIRPRHCILPFPSGIPGQQATGRDPIISRRVGWSALQALSVPHAYKALEVRSSVRPVAIAAPRPYKRRHTHSGPVTDAVTNRAAVTSGLLGSFGHAARIRQPAMSPFTDGDQAGDQRPKQR